jgi:hypothetical protein
MTGPVFRAGRDIKGAFATAQRASATATWSEQNAPDPNIDLAAALTAIREALAQLPGIDTKALTRLDEAKDEAQKSNPKPEEIETLVAQATRYAQDAEGFTEAAATLLPRLQQVAAWLGRTWQSWAPMLGLG